MQVRSQHARWISNSEASAACRGVIISSSGHRKSFRALLRTVRMGLVWCFHGPIRLAHVNYFTTQIKEALKSSSSKIWRQAKNPGEV